MAHSTVVFYQIASLVGLLVHVELAIAVGAAHPTSNLALARFIFCDKRTQPSRLFGAVKLGAPSNAAKLL